MTMTKTFFPGLLYAIGGYDGQERLRTVEAYDAEKRVWRVVAPMNARRRLVIFLVILNNLFGV